MAEKVDEVEEEIEEIIVDEDGVFYRDREAEEEIRRFCMEHGLERIAEKIVAVYSQAFCEKQL